MKTVRTKGRGIRTTLWTDEGIAAGLNSYEVRQSNDASAGFRKQDGMDLEAEALCIRDLAVADRHKNALLNLSSERARIVLRQF